MIRGKIAKYIILIALTGIAVASNSCGCSSSSLSTVGNPTTDGGASQTTDNKLFEDGPIDIPVPIAKSIDGIDPANVNITFTEGSPNLSVVKFATTPTGTYDIAGVDGAVPAATPIVLCQNLDTGEAQSVNRTDSGSFNCAVAGSIGDQLYIANATGDTNDADTVTGTPIVATMNAAGEVTYIKTNNSNLIINNSLVVDANQQAYYAVYGLADEANALVKNATPEGCGILMQPLDSQTVGETTTRVLTTGLESCPVKMAVLSGNALIFLTSNGLLQFIPLFDGSDDRDVRTIQDYGITITEEMEIKLLVFPALDHDGETAIIYFPNDESFYVNDEYVQWATVDLDDQGYYVANDRADDLSDQFIETMAIDGNQELLGYYLLSHTPNGSSLEWVEQGDRENGEILIAAEEFPYYPVWIDTSQTGNRVVTAAYDHNGGATDIILFLYNDGDAGFTALSALSDESLYFHHPLMSPQDDFIIVCGQESTEASGGHLYIHRIDVDDTNEFTVLTSGDDFACLPDTINYSIDGENNVNFYQGGQHRMILATQNSLIVEALE